jgi:hypothetical protein
MVTALITGSNVSHGPNNSHGSCHVLPEFAALRNFEMFGTEKEITGDPIALC